MGFSAVASKRLRRVDCEAEKQWGCRAEQREGNGQRVMAGCAIHLYICPGPGCAWGGAV